MGYNVTRGSDRRCPDRLEVMGEHGCLAVSCTMGPGGALHPHSAQEARERPWFYTGSPFGAQIIGLAWERHSSASRNARVIGSTIDGRQPVPSEYGSIPITLVDVNRIQHARNAGEI